MTDSMIERVKAAIADKLAPAIDMHAPYAKVMLDMAARAAIEALREPTEEMIVAGERPFDEPFTGGRLTPASAVYEAMIDKALK